MSRNANGCDESLESVVKQLGQGINSLLSMVDRGLCGEPLETPRAAVVAHTEIPITNPSYYSAAAVMKRKRSTGNAKLRDGRSKSPGSILRKQPIHHGQYSSNFDALAQTTWKKNIKSLSPSRGTKSVTRSLSAETSERRPPAYDKSRKRSPTVSPPNPGRLITTSHKGNVPKAIKDAKRSGIPLTTSSGATPPPAAIKELRAPKRTVPVVSPAAQSLKSDSRQPSPWRLLNNNTDNGAKDPPKAEKPATDSKKESSAPLSAKPSPLPVLNGTQEIREVHSIHEKVEEKERSPKIIPKEQPVPQEELKVVSEPPPVKAPLKGVPKLSLGGVIEKKQTDPSFTYEKFLTQLTGEEDIRAAHEVPVAKKPDEQTNGVTPAPAPLPSDDSPPPYDAIKHSPPASSSAAPAAPQPMKGPLKCVPKLSLGGVMQQKATDPSFTYEKFLTITTGEEDIRATPTVDIPVKG